MDILRYKGIPVYVISLPVFGHEEAFFFTQIPFGELQRIKHYLEFQSIPATDLEDQIFRDYTLPQGVIDLDILDGYPGGLVTTVARLILRLSDPSIWPNEEGVVDAGYFNAKLDLHRTIADRSIEFHMMTIICAVFRAYTFEALKELPFDQIMQLFTCAERHMIELGALSEPWVFYNEMPGQPEPMVAADDIDTLMAKTAARVNTEMAPEAPRMLSDPSKPAIVEEAKPTSEQERQKQVREAPGKRGYVEPSAEHPVAVINPKTGTTMQVPGVDLSGGFTEQDWEVPTMTDEEALAEAAYNYDLEPAGIEYIRAREAYLADMKKKQAKTEDRQRPLVSLKQQYKLRKRKESE